MELRTTTGKDSVGDGGVVVPWLQAPPPPASPASPDEIIQEVMGRPGENDGEAMDEADAVAGVLPEGEETVSPPPGLLRNRRGRRRSSKKLSVCFRRRLLRTRM